MTEQTCPFCDLDPARVFYRGTNVFGVWDAYPVSEGHALLVTTRHIASLKFPGRKDKNLNRFKQIAQN